MKLEIVLDIDQCLCDFIGGYESKFKVNFEDSKSSTITKRVIKLRNDSKFWTGLNPLCELDFKPIAYCTSRINSKYSTKKWLSLNNFPNSPVYQVCGYGLSKVPKLRKIPHKGDYVIFIDDNYKNVEMAQKAGFNALLLDTPYNRDIQTNLRISDLKYKTIENAFRRLYF